MLSRKRKRDYISDSQSTDAATQSRTLSIEPESFSQSIPSISSSGNSSYQSGTSYEIKGITAESEHQYLIDWADNPVTGEVYGATWQPKANASAAAVEVWEARLLSAASQSQDYLEPSCDSSFRPTFGSGETCCSELPGRAKHIALIEASGDSSDEQDRSCVSLSPRSQGSHTVPLEATDVAGLIIRVSQHCSLDRDLYKAYEYSISASSAAATPRTNSRGTPDYRSLGASSGDGIIPDSQPPPAGLNYAGESLRGSSVEVNNDTCTTKYSHTVEQLQNSGCVIIPSSQPSTDFFRKSISVPPATARQRLPSVLGQRDTFTLSRSKSDGQIPASSFCNRDSRQPSPVEIADSAKRSIQITKQPQHEETGLNTHTIDAGETALSSGVVDCSQDSGRPLSARAHGENLQKDLRPKAVANNLMHATGASYGDGSARDKSQSDTNLSQQARILSQDRHSNTLQHHQGQSSALPTSSQMSMASQAASDPQSSTVREMDSSDYQRRDSRGWSQYINDQRDARQIQSVEGHHGRMLFHHNQPTPQSPSGQAFDIFNNTSGVDERSEKIPKFARQPISPSTRSPMTQTALRGTLFPGPQSPLHKTFSPTDSPSPDPTDRRVSKSPSVIPDTIPYATEPEPSRLEAQPLEIDTTFRQPVPRAIHPHSVPHTPITPSKLALQHQVPLSQDESAIRILGNSGREQFVPLSMPGRIRDAYCNVIRFYSDSIRPLFNQRPCKRETVEGINKLLDGVSNVTTHLDLQGSGPNNLDQVDPQSEAAYAEACSEKFAFLGHVIEKTRHARLNLFIAAKQGALMGIIETFLKAKNATWTRFDENGNNQYPRSETGLTVFLIPSDGSYDTSKLQWPQPDIVIGFDETLSLDRVSYFHRSSNPVPVIRLVVYASLEHIDLCLPRDLNPIERLRRLVWILLQTQKRVGSLNEPTSKASAESVSTWMQNQVTKRRERGWLSAEVPPINDISLMVDGDSQLAEAQPDYLEPEGVSRYWPNPIIPAVATPPRQPRQKRSFDLVWGEPLQRQAKKLRMGSSYHDEFADLQPNETTDSLAQRLSSARYTINELERKLNAKAALCSDMEQSLSVRQYEYENVRKENGDLKLAQARAASDVMAQAERARRLEQSNTNLVEQKRILEDSNTQYLEQIKTHPNAVIAANAQDGAELERLRTENGILSRKLTSVEGSFEFTRQQYQEASTVAAEASGTIRELESTISELQRKVDSEAGRFRLAADSEIQQRLMKRIQRQDAQIKQRDQLQQKLESEMAELRRGRGGMQTRGSSQQPRSPRGGGSRGVSPAPAFLGGHAMVRGGSGLGNRFGGP